MESDPIQNLLRAADQQSSAATSDPRVMADRVLRVSSRRRATRVVAALVLVLAASIFTTNFRNPPQGSTPVAVNRVQQVQTVDFHSQIAVGEMIVKRLEQNEARISRTQRIASLEMRPDEDQLIERTAARLVAQADRALRESRDPGPALRAYRQVVSSFPQAISAQVARQRITQIEKAG